MISSQNNEFYIGHCCPLVTIENTQLEERVFPAKGFFAFKVHSDEVGIIHRISE